MAASILAGINLVFFSPELSGKVLFQSDMINNRGMAREAMAHFEKTGRPTYWTNAMFGGMPTYQIYVPQTKSNLFEFLIKGLSLSFSGSLKYYLILSLGAFLGLCCLGMGPWLSLIGAYSIAFATNHVVLVSSGHLTKIGALGFVPMILAGAYLLFNKNWKWGSVVFAFGLAGSLRMNHIQMTYQAGILLAIYVLAETILRVKKKRVNTLIRPALGLLFGVIASFLVNYSLLMGMRSYAGETSRGGSVLSGHTAKESDGSAGGKNGLDWEYAMQWSEGYKDLMSLLVPGAVGGSTNEVWSKKSKMAAALEKNGIAVPDRFTLPMYWGELPNTKGPDYLGILLVLAFIMGLILVKGPLKWMVLTAAAFLVLQSLGHHFSILNKPLFEFVPYYNKFRAPNSILNVLSTLVPLFSIYGLYLFMQHAWTKKSILSLFKKTVLPLAGALILILVLGPQIFEMKSDLGDPDWKTNRELYEALLQERRSYLNSDTVRALVILFIGAGLLYLYALKKLKPQDFILAFGLLVGFDLWMVAKRYVNAGNFVTEPSIHSIFKPRAVDQEILRDSSLSYRVLDLSVNTFNTAIPSYFHKTIGGYSATKLSRYQDMVERHFSQNNRNALNMMNTKYIIDKKGVLEQNPDALGNAWFVSRVNTVNTPREEIEAINSMDPAEEAVLLQKEFKNLEVLPSYQKNGIIRLVQYSPDHLIYETETSSEQFAVFSEVWYGPDKGWHARIDGRPANHVRVNFLLRAMPVPAGKHQIEFKFAPPEMAANNISFYAGTFLGLWVLTSIGTALKKQWTPIPDLDGPQKNTDRHPSGSGKTG
ncbi:MAG TPA: hypothetical protein PKM27_01715 [Saprospiraceae bacterium]|nr:hypothetical protein [Saprospiraceae bacterium]HNT20912.1 hypothetical protein [Saprospiraceae bacterium]